MHVLASSPATITCEMPCCFSWKSRSVLAKPLDPQCSDATIARLQCEEVGMPLASPFTARKSDGRHDLALVRVRMAPGRVVARLPAAVRHDDDLDAGISNT